MNIFKKQNNITQMNDVNLVVMSLGGNKNAFCEIVTRYQNLLCSLAYSSVGNIKCSEDIAQEVFIEAWKKLDTLNDPEKLKAWLCGILRFKVSRYHRKENTQPIKGASELEDHNDQKSDKEQMDNNVIQEQEQMLLWQTLDKMDDNYREPLILFYREDQSVERVATQLDLSINTTKQRLSRGRKLLKRAMITFIEEGLTKSKPSIGFTAGVLAALNGIAPPAKAVTLGAGAAKTSSLFQLSIIVTFLAAFSGVISSFFGVKASLKQSRTLRERQQVIKITVMFFLFAIVYILGMFALKHFALNSASNLQIYALTSQLLVLCFVVIYFFLVHRMFQNTKKLRAQERIFNPEAFHRPVDQIGSKRREYKSKWQLLGLPLFHFQFGMIETNDKPAVAWFAGGSKAYGLIFAWGGVAIAPISVGIISAGVVSVGVIGFGLIGLGTVAIGVIGFGASAIAYKAYGSLSALGWESAFSNGFSIAKNAAIAPIAYAEQVNNEHAANIANLTLLGESYQWLLALIAILVIVPSIWHSHQVQKRME
jgi:RNA polymerase sigma factor (sigma-70 family)